MTVTVRFESPDYNVERSTRQLIRIGTDRHIVVDDKPIMFSFEGFDLDHLRLTVYANWNDGQNYTLAIPANFANEAGEECGMIGWLIEPESALIALRPDLAEHVGKRYGRVLVTAIAWEDFLHRKDA